MNHSPITKHAVQVLTNPGSNQKQRDVAVATLVAAADEALAPREAAPVLWSYILTNPAGSYVSRAADAIARSLPLDPSILSAATTAVSSPETTEDLFEAALTILTGKPYAAQVKPEVLLSASECSVMKGRRSALFVPQLIEAVHDLGGGLPLEILRALRDGWSRSVDVDQRCEAAEIGKLIPAMDLVWLGMMLGDPSYKVRRSTAQLIYRFPAPEQALPVIEDRIGQEAHADVLSALFDAKGDIIREMERRARKAR